MTIGVFEAATVHKAKILSRRWVGLAACAHGHIDQLADTVLGVRRQAQYNLRGFMYVGNGLVRELALFVVS